MGLSRTSYHAARRAYRAALHQRRRAFLTAEAATGDQRLRELAEVAAEPSPVPPPGYDTRLGLDPLLARKYRRMHFANAKADYRRAMSQLTELQLRYGDRRTAHVDVAGAWNVFAAIRQEIYDWRYEQTVARLARIGRAA